MLGASKLFPFNQRLPSSVAQYSDTETRLTRYTIPGNSVGYLKSSCRSKTMVQFERSATIIILFKTYNIPQTNIPVKVLKADTSNDGVTPLLRNKKYMTG